MSDLQPENTEVMPEEVAVVEEKENAKEGFFDGLLEKIAADVVQNVVEDVAGAALDAVGHKPVTTRFRAQATQTIGSLQQMAASSVQENEGLTTGRKLSV